MSKNKNIFYFSGIQINALIATLGDYIIFLILVEVFKVDKVLSSIFGALFGGVLNFVLNRYLLFHSSQKLKGEAFKYIFVSSFSLILNVSLFWLLLRSFSNTYVYLKIFVSIIVSIFWNYPMQRYWVFHHDSKGSQSKA